MPPWAISAASSISISKSILAGVKALREMSAVETGLCMRSSIEHDRREADVIKGKRKEEDEWHKVQSTAEGAQRRCTCVLVVRLVLMQRKRFALSLAHSCHGGVGSTCLAGLLMRYKAHALEGGFHSAGVVVACTRCCWLEGRCQP